MFSNTVVKYLLEHWCKFVIAPSETTRHKNWVESLAKSVQADGVGFLNNINAIVCCEGSRPGARVKKIIDNIKNIESMVRLYNHIVISEATARRQLFSDLRIYGVTTFKREVLLTMMDFPCGKFFIVPLYLCIC